MTSRHNKLVLVLSQGKSLSWWVETGLFSREILLYLRLLRDDVFDRVAIFSYDPADRDLVAGLALDDPLYRRVDILAPNRSATKRWRGLAWSVIGPLRHAATIGAAHAIKTNQLNSVLAALIANWRTRRPLVLRYGYLLSSSYQDAGRTWRAAMTRVIERIAYGTATRILVSSRRMERHVVERGFADKVLRTPTYVDVTAFRAKTDYDFTTPLVWIGRPAAQKNLENLIEACALSKRELTLIGFREADSGLGEVVRRTGASVHFAGRIANEHLAARLNQHAVFILPSFYEGLPKVLIEAMACGLVCIASNVPGITDLIRDEDTGYLIDGFDAPAIARVIDHVFAQSDDAVGRRARASIERDYSLDGYVAREADVYARL